MFHEFDQLHVVSDLHFGGQTGFQIFDQGVEFAALARHLAATGTGRIGLVLNGDIVDFLAEVTDGDESVYLDATGAAEKLERIFADPAFAESWAALGEYVKTPSRTLVLVLGNHDVELALPRVRQRLLAKLCGDDEGARGRVIFAVDGSGFACRVGERRVLCLHGNEVDTWNVVDYFALLQTARALNRGQPSPEWNPNAGTKLVIDIMNPIKKKHPFVDLLKPETEAVPAVLLAVDPGQVRQVTKFSPVAFRLARDAVKKSIGFLSAEDAPNEETEKPAVAMLGLLGKSYGLGAATDPADIDALLEQTELWVDAEKEAADLLGEMNGETLGLFDIIVDRIRGRSPEENLRRTLEDWIGSDASFDVGKVDKTFKKLDKAVGPRVDFLVAGHTHLHRAISRPGGGAYFNSGTWIRLIRLTSEILGDPQKFAPVFQALDSDSMSALDAVPDLVLRRPTVVTITTDPSGKAVGELREVRITQAGTALEPVPNSRLEV